MLLIRDQFLIVNTDRIFFRLSRTDPPNIRTFRWFPACLAGSPTQNDTTNRPGRMVTTAPEPGNQDLPGEGLEIGGRPPRNSHPNYGNLSASVVMGNPGFGARFGTENAPDPGLAPSSKTPRAQKTKKNRSPRSGLTRSNCRRFLTPPTPKTGAAHKINDGPRPAHPSRYDAPSHERGAYAGSSVHRTLGEPRNATLHTSSTKANRDSEHRDESSLTPTTSTTQRAND